MLVYGYVANAIDFLNEQIPNLVTKQEKNFTIDFPSMLEVLETAHKWVFLRREIQMGLTAMIETHGLFVETLFGKDNESQTPNIFDNNGE